MSSDRSQASGSHPGTPSFQLTQSSRSGSLQSSPRAKNSDASSGGDRNMATPGTRSMQSNSAHSSPRDDNSTTSAADKQANSSSTASPRRYQGSNSTSPNSSPRDTKGKISSTGDKGTASPRKDPPLTAPASSLTTTSRTSPRDKQTEDKSVVDIRRASPQRGRPAVSPSSNLESASKTSSGGPKVAGSPQSPVPRLPSIPRETPSPPLAPRERTGPVATDSDQPANSPSGSVGIPRAPETPPPASRPSPRQHASPATPSAGDRGGVTSSPNPTDESPVPHTPKSSSVTSRYQPISSDMTFGTGATRRPTRSPGPRFTPDFSPTKLKAATSTLSRLTLEPKPRNRMEIQAMIGHVDSESRSVETDSRARFSNQTPSSVVQRKVEAKRKLAVLMSSKERLQSAAACYDGEDFKRLMRQAVEELKAYYGETS